MEKKTSQAETTVRPIAQAAPAPVSAQNRLGFIDALRAFGALYILVYHVMLIPRPALEAPAWIYKIILGGGTGVILFFVLSAFTLMLSMRRQTAESGSDVDFYLRRFFRIAPLYYLWIVASLIRDKLYGRTHALWIILVNVIFCFNVIPGENQGIVWAGWVLGVEMMFYVIFPFLYRAVDKLWKSVAFVVASIAFSGLYSWVLATFTTMDTAAREKYIYFGFPEYLPAFAIGMTVFLVYEKLIQNKKPKWSWGIAGIGCAVFLYAIVLMYRVPYGVNCTTLAAAAYGMLVLGLAIAPVKILVNPLSRFLGEISYSIFLNHPTIVWAFIPMFLYLYTLPIPLTLKFGAACLLTLEVVTVLSIGTYELIEKPGIRLGRWVIKRAQPIIPAWLKRTAAPKVHTGPETPWERLSRKVDQRMERMLSDAEKIVWPKIYAGANDAAQKIIRRGWRHLAVWAGLLVYMLVAPGMYDEFLAAEGQPLSGAGGGTPSNDSRVLAQVYNLVAMDDQGLFRLRGWAFLNDEDKQPAGEYEKRVVLSTLQGMRIYAAEDERSFDVDVIYKALGMDLTLAGFSASIYKNGLAPGMYSLGVTLTHKPDGQSSYASLKACILKTPNQLLLKDLTDPECRAAGALTGKPVGGNEPLPGGTAEWKMWIEEMESISADGFYRVKGWAFLTVDKTVAAGGYDRRMVLTGPEGNFIFAADSVFRPDVDEYFKSDGMDLLMSGFSVLIDGGSLAPGVYGIGLIFTDRVSHEEYFVDAQRCFSRTEGELILEKNGSQACRQPYLAASPNPFPDGETEGKTG